MSYQVGDVVESLRSGIHYKLLNNKGIEWTVQCINLNGATATAVDVGSILSMMDSRFKLVYSTNLPPAIAEKEQLVTIQQEIIEARQALRRFLKGEV